MDRNFLLEEIAFYLEELGVFGNYFREHLENNDHTEINEFIDQIYEEANTLRKLIKMLKGPGE